MKASNRKGHDALVKSYEEYIKQGESGKAVTNGLIDAVMHMLIGPARLARIKNIEEQRMRIREAYRLFEENHGTGKLYLNDLIAAMANYMLDNEIPKQKTADDDDDDEDDEDFEIINIREPASMGKFYEPPPLKIDDVEAYRQRARIAAGLVFYNDIEVIRRCLESLKDFDLVICIDGRYDIANGLPLSTDGSREVVKSFDNTLLVDMPFRQQTDLRNMYLDEAVWNDCDYLLVIEADEYVTGDMEAFRMNLPAMPESDEPDAPYIARATDVVYNIPMHYVGQNHVVKSPRFFCRPHLIRYGGTHSTYIVNGYQFLASNGNESVTFTTLGDITVNHDEKPRTAAQEKRAQKYQKRLVAQEKAERTALKKAGRVL